jgi:hypothetical protein
MSILLACYKCYRSQHLQKTTGWYTKMGERIWTPWFIKFVHSRGYFNIYTNLLKERALSVSHRDAGVNYGKSVGPDSTLLDEKNLDFNIWDLQPLKKLKWYDFCFNKVLPGRLVRKFNEVGSVLKSVQVKSTVVIINLYSIEQSFARNLICHLDKTGIQNYIFLGDNPEFLEDLAHRGYPVIDATEFYQSIKTSSFMGADDDIFKETRVISYLMKSCLDQGYNLWILNGNMISLGSKLMEPSDKSVEFFTAEDVGLMFIRSSVDSKTTWNELILSRLRAMSMSSDSSSSFKQKNFVGLLTEVLGKSAGVRLGKLNEGLKAIELGPDTSNRSISEGQSNFLFWPNNMASDYVQRQLENMNLWLIDSDSSCNAVYCHQ